MHTAFYGAAAIIALVWLYVCLQGFWDNLQDHFALQAIADAQRLMSQSRADHSTIPDCRVDWSCWLGHDAVTKEYRPGDLQHILGGGGDKNK